MVTEMFRLHVCLQIWGLDSLQFPILMRLSDYVKLVSRVNDLNLTQTLVSETYAEQLAKTGYRVKCQWAIDTGMNRIGINANNLNHCEQMIRTYAERLDLNGIFTHLCVADSSDEEDKIFTRNQIEKFEATICSLLQFGRRLVIY